MLTQLLSHCEIEKRKLKELQKGNEIECAKANKTCETSREGMKQWDGH